MFCDTTKTEKLRNGLSVISISLAKARVCRRPWADEHYSVSQLHREF